jgi:hypothetical protein
MAGIAASIMLVAFGIGSVVTGISGRDRVHSDLAARALSAHLTPAFRVSSSTRAPRPRLSRP